MMLVKKINGSHAGVSMIGAVCRQSWTDCGSNDSRRNYKYFVLCTGSLVAGLITGAIIGIISKRVLVAIKVKQIFFTL